MMYIVNSFTTPKSILSLLVFKPSLSYANFLQIDLIQQFYCCSLEFTLHRLVLRFDVKLKGKKAY